MGNSNIVDSTGSLVNPGYAPKDHLMTSVNMHEAKTQLSKRVEAMKNGTEDESTIPKDGVPSAKPVAIEPKGKRRRGSSLCKRNAKIWYRIPQTHC
jgi:antitoxin (DNA-binding transcriptional repressor) of toxin-antitoxin stability system